jgi:hypothetical protein
MGNADAPGTRINHVRYVCPTATETDASLWVFAALGAVDGDLYAIPL